MYVICLKGIRTFWSCFILAKIRYHLAYRATHALSKSGACLNNFVLIYMNIKVADYGFVMCNGQFRGTSRWQK